MLVLMQILRCGSGRQKEALKRLHWIHGLMAERDDSGGCIVAKHLGNPIDLLILRFWETQAAMARHTNAYYQDRWPLFPPNEPEGIYQTQDIAHHWEEVRRSDGDAAGAFIWRITRNVPKDRWSEFLKLRESEDELMKRCEGLVYARTFRSVENEEQALTIVRLRDRESLEEVATLPEMAGAETELRRFTSFLEYPALDIYHSECFEISDEYPAARRRG